MKNQNFMNWKTPGWAIITGASSGIGKEFAEQLGTQGFNLILVARREERLKNLKKDFENRFKIKVNYITADLSNSNEVDPLISQLKEYSDLNVLINNAGFGVIGKFEEINIDTHLNMIKVHMETPVKLSYAMVKIMKKNNQGVIIYTSSNAAFSPIAFNGLYSPTKSFLVELAEVLSMELKNTNIKVQALCPGLVRTEFHDSEDLQSAKTSFPKFMWSSASKIVLKSLKSVSKGISVCIPGALHYFLAKFIPRSIQKKVFLKLWSK